MESTIILLLALIKSYGHNVHTLRVCAACVKAQLCCKLDKISPSLKKKFLYTVLCVCDMRKMNAHLQHDQRVWLGTLEEEEGRKNTEEQPLCSQTGGSTCCMVEEKKSAKHIH